MYLLSKMAVFHCYVSLPEGNWIKSDANVQLVIVDFFPSNEHFEWTIEFLPLQQNPLIFSPSLMTFLTPLFNTSFCKTPSPPWKVTNCWVCVWFWGLFAWNRYPLWFFPCFPSIRFTAVSWGSVVSPTGFYVCPPCKDSLLKMGWPFSR